MTVEEIKAALRKPFMNVFLDGRNEHGSHVLYGGADNLAELTDMALELLEDQSVGYAENVISEAEALGYEVGHHVTTIWSQHGDWETGPYVELEGVCSVLSETFFGSPNEQREDIKKHTEIEAA